MPEFAPVVSAVRGSLMPASSASDAASVVHRPYDGPMTDPSKAATPTLYEWAGGDEAFARLIDCFYDRVEQDELISPLFPGGVSREHREHVTAWWQEVFGGPARYTEELGGYAAMVSKHLGLDISIEQRRGFVELMSVAADDAGLPDDPEFRSALLAYLEWGTRLAFENSQPGADVVPQAPVPRWGWGEAPPYDGLRAAGPVTRLRWDHCPALPRAVQPCPNPLGRGLAVEAGEITAPRDLAVGCSADGLRPAICFRSGDHCVEGPRTRPLSRRVRARSPGRRTPQSWSCMTSSSPSTSRSYSVPPCPLWQPRSRWYQRLLASTSRTAISGWGRMRTKANDSAIRRSAPPRARCARRCARARTR